MDYFIVAVLLLLGGGSRSASPAVPIFPCPPVPRVAETHDLLKAVLNYCARAYSHVLNVREAVTAAAFSPGQSYEEADLMMEG